MGIALIIVTHVPHSYWHYYVVMKGTDTSCAKNWCQNVEITLRGGKTVGF